MKRILFILSFLFLSVMSFSQVFTNPRSSSSITVQDPRLSIPMNLYIPRLGDSTLFGGLDSLGAILYDRSRRKIWIRDTVLTGGHHWLNILTGNDTSSLGRNISNAALRANGDYLQKWQSHVLSIDSIDGLLLLRAKTIGSGGNRNKDFRLLWDGPESGNSPDAFELISSLKKSDGTTDSIWRGILSETNGLMRLIQRNEGHYNAGIAINNGLFTSISAGSLMTGHGSIVSMDTGRIIIQSDYDSIMIKGARSAPTADSILAVGPIIGNYQTVLKIPFPVITSLVNNGISKTGDTTQLGGALTHNTTISNGSLILSMTGTNANELFNMTNSGSGRAILGSSVDAPTFEGSSTNASVFSGISTNGVPVNVTSTNNMAGQFAINPSDSNGLVTVLQSIRTTQHTAVAGIGQRFDFYNQTSSGSALLSNRLISKLTNATTGSQSSQFIINGVNIGSNIDLFTLNGNGQAQLNQYTSTNFQTIDTSFNSLVVDGSGNIFKRAGGSGGSAVISANAIKDTMLRQSVGLSIIGRDTSTTGNVKDITAASDGQVLRRNGTKIGFGAINLSSSNAITGNLPVSKLDNGINGNAQTWWNGSGKWKDIGVSTYFKAGEDTTFTAIGDSIYTNPSFAGYLDYDVYRNGSLQYWDTVSGVQVDNAIGRVIFHPKLDSSDKIVIKATRRSPLRLPPFASFNVNTVTGIAAWYDATDPTSISIATGVSTWADKGPHTRNLTMSNGSYQPAYHSSGGSNNLPYINFASNSVLNYSFTTNDTGAICGYLVIRVASWVAGGRPFLYNYTTVGGGAGIIANNDGAFNVGPTLYDGVGQSFADLNANDPNWQIISFYQRGYPSSALKKNKLGGSIKGFEQPGTGNPSSIITSDYKLNWTQTQPFDISEMIIIKGAPTSTDDNNIKNYLINKYGIVQKNSILFFGDSHTGGTMSGTPTGTPYYILSTQEKGYDFMNYAVGGTVVWPFGSNTGLTGGNLIDLYTQFDAPIQTNSPMVVFQYGTNDGPNPTNATWVTTYKTAIQHMINLGIAPSRIVICSPPYNSASGYAANLAAAEPIIRNIASDMGVQYCDFYDYMISLGLDINTVPGGDGIHGNGPIHRALADLLETFMP